MGARLLRDLKNGTDISVPQWDIGLIPEITMIIAGELSVDTFVDLTPCIFIYLNRTSKSIALGSGCILSDYTNDREHDYYSVELEDDGSVALYYRGMNMKHSGLVRLLGEEVYNFHTGILCQNYEGLLVTIRLIFEELFDNITYDTRIFIQKYRIFAIQKIVQEIKGSAVSIGFRSDNYYRYRTGDIETDIISSAVDEVLDDFVNILGR